MASRVRKLISSRICEILKLSNEISTRDSICAALTLNLSHDNLPQLHLIASTFRPIVKSQNVPFDSSFKKILSSSFTDLTVKPPIFSGNKVSFTLDRNECLQEVFNPEKSLNLSDEPTENIIIEFSSPNIAKPFHMGHLRSTIIGNALANLFMIFNHHVIRINYLGDWGTQFGYLKLGMELSNSTNDEIKKNPIKHLFDAYVNANRLAENDKQFAEKARNIFTNMENGDSSDLNAWNQYREYTVAELKQVYKRLGVHFDIYEWESQYCKSNIKHILNCLQEQNLLFTETDGKQSYETKDGKCVPLVKSDGSTLYLTRDVAAIVERQKNYHFDRMIYVVGNDQHAHFQTLFEIVQCFGVPNANKLQHVKFGRVEKMSTRRGNVVFLADVLDEIKDLMYEKQILGKNTRIDVATDQQTADNLGVSALISYELQRNRLSSYAFDVNNVLEDVSGGGKNFQYTHCRLISLEQKVPSISGPIEFKPEFLDEIEAIALAIDIAKFPEILLRAKIELGPHIILAYLFNLNSRISKTLSKLNVSRETNPERKAQRILLFRTAKETLATGMKLIGITPLEKM